jgi:hypothetical protein
VSNNGRVCTLEAIAALLLALEGDAALQAGLLGAVRLKVDMAQLALGLPSVYGTADRDSFLVAPGAEGAAT